MNSKLIVACAASLLCLFPAGCVHRGLYEKKDGSTVSTVDWKIGEAELAAVREEITKDLVRTGFIHGIPPLWHLRVRPAEAYRNEFVYVLPLLSFHWDRVTIGNIANFRITDAPISHGLVTNWPWSGDTNLLFLWQNRYAYYAVCDGDTIILYKDYVGSFLFLPLTRLFVSPREVSRIRQAAAS